MIGTGRRNLDPGPSSSTLGLVETGDAREFVRTPRQLSPELRPRAYLVNGGRTTGGDLGLNANPLGPIADDYTRPDGDTSSGSSTTPAAGSEDCGCG